LGGIQILSDAFGPVNANGGSSYAIWPGTFRNDQWAMAQVSTIAPPTSTVAITAAVQSGGNTTYTYTLTSGNALIAPQWIIITGMTNAGNNSNGRTFLTTSLGTGTFTVANTSGVTESGSSGVGVSPSDSGSGLVVRGTPDGLNAYYFTAGTNSFNGGTQIYYKELWKYVKGVGTFLWGLYPPAYPPNSPGDVYLLTVAGTAITVYQNGHELRAYHDSSLSSGSPGISTWSLSGPQEYNWANWQNAGVMGTPPGNNGTRWTNWQAGSSGSCVINVTFTPTTSGNRSGSLTLTDNASNSPQTIGLTGLGLGAPGAQLSTASLSFANQNLNIASPAQTVTLTNTGSATLDITSIVASGDFAPVNNCGSRVIAGGSCAINVTFTPTATGIRTGSLTITDNGSTSPQTINLSGESVAAMILSSHQISLTTGQTVQFQVAFINEYSGAVAWSVDGTPGGDFSVGTVSSSGLYTPPSTIGQHTIQVAMGSQTDSAQVYVTTLPGGVLTQRYDNSRIGLNAQETVLSPTNVNQNQFGKLCALRVDGQVYAEPLYMQNVSINGIMHNVVFVATEHDSVYAFDADGQSTTPLWHTSFLNPATGVTTVPWQDVGVNDIAPEIGITSTPIIDATGGTIYLTAKTKELQNDSCTLHCAHKYVHRLHALDITTGAEKLGGPVEISASVPGTGYDRVNGTVTFGALRQLQRPALLLDNGTVYIGFGSQGDIDYYHGWLMAYDATSLQQIAVFNVTPDGGRGALWQGGGGFSVDPQGNLYIVTANGTFDANTPNGVDYGDSVVKLQLNSSGQFQVLDYFTPDNEAILEADDLDLGSDPTLILPDQPGPYPYLLATAGKDGRLWILNRDNLGKLQPQDGGAVQVIQDFNGMLYAGGAYWNNSLYFQAVNDVLRGFPLQNGLAQTPALSTSVIGYPGAPLAVSANGTSNGIVWMVQADAFGTGGPAVLHAFDPSNVATEFYNSAQALNFRDQAGPAVKFVVPTVANGKVYVGTGNEVDVYGLLP
jgi:hypothetical protein